MGVITVYIISNAVSFSEAGWGADNYRIFFFDPIQLCHVLRKRTGTFGDVANHMEFHYPLILALFVIVFFVCGNG